jgi:hypothetical protein
MPDTAPPRGSIDDSCLRLFINDLFDNGQRLSVMCNGVELERVVEYDTIKGFAIIHQLRDGKPFTEDGKTVAKMRVEGSVSVTIVNDPNSRSRSRFDVGS